MERPYPEDATAYGRASVGRADMSFLDKFKEKADDLVQSAKDRVSDATGVDTDKLIDAAGSVRDAGSNLSDAADSLREGKLPE